MVIDYKSTLLEQDLRLILEKHMLVVTLKEQERIQ